MRAPRPISADVGPARGQPERLPELRSVPTIAESGYSGFDVTPVFGLYVPAATPKEAIAVLSATVRKAVDTPDVCEKLAAQAVVPSSSTPEELGKILASEIAQWAR